MSRLDTALARLGLQIKQETVPKERPPYIYRDAYGMDIYRENVDEQLSDRKLQEQAMACAWVYSDITLLARKEKQACYRVMDGDEEVPDHPLTALLKRPNPLMSGGFLKGYTSMWRNLDGNAYWWLAANNSGELVEIWPLPARDIEPVQARRGDNEVLAGYYYKPMRKLLPPSMICHFRLENPFDILLGLSPLGALRLQITGDRAMWAWNTNFFDKKNAIPTAIISFPADTDDVDFARLREMLYEEFGSANRRVAVTRAGDIDVEVIGLSQKDMEFLAGIELNRRTIDRVFGIPSGYWSESASRNVSETAELIVMRDTVQPAVDYQASEIDAQIVDRYYEKELSVKADNLVPEDRELRLNEYSAKAPVLKIDEARQEWGENPIGGELGNTLVGLIPALGQMMGAGLAPAAQPVEQPVKTLAQPGIVDVMADDGARRELQLWRKLAVRRAADGADAGDRHFESECIAPCLKARIEAALEGVRDPERVKEVFEVYA